MIPTPWPSLLLALAVLRLTRLAGWDTFPPIVRARRWLTDEYIVTRGTGNAHLRQSADPLVEVVEHGRPLVHELLTCAYCLGFWISACTYTLWIFEPRWTLYAAVPFALSSVVGIAAHWLDP